MTIKRLLENLNKTAQNYNDTRTFRVIAKHKYGNAKYIYIWVEQKHNNGETAPEFLLTYRLDLSDLIEIQKLYTGVLYASLYAKFENAIKEDK